MSKFTRAFGYFSLGFVISLLINYWLRQEEHRSQHQAPQYTPPRPPSPPPAPPRPPRQAAPRKPVTKATPDDLTQITGIGPKTAEILNAAGITTYAAIAATPPAELLEKLAGVRGVNRDKVNAWVKQARKLSS